MAYKDVDLDQLNALTEDFMSFENPKPQIIEPQPIQAIQVI